nr:hypothetical protein [Actinomycetota bacterium]
MNTITLAAFPTMLTELDQWVIWRAEKRSLGSGEIKWTKVPYVAGTHRRASSTDPATWGTFADARADAQRPAQMHPGVSASCSLPTTPLPGSTWTVASWTTASSTPRRAIS